MDKLEEYARAVATRMARYPSERYGQAAFNVLYFEEFDPEFADEIRGGPLDPFYDNNVDPMLVALAARWS